jgi:hypothetical protein
MQRKPLAIHFDERIAKRDDVGGEIAHARGDRLNAAAIDTV